MVKSFCNCRKSFVVCVLAMLCALLALLPACSQGSSVEEPLDTASSELRSFTDSCGRTVEIPQEVDRVAVTGAASQLVMFTFAPERLVGLSTALDDSQVRFFGAEYAELPVLGQIYGTKGNLNKEALAAAAPELIVDIGEAKGTIVEDMDALQEQLGIPCIHVEATLDTYDQAYLMLGDALGMPERAAELSSYCRNVYDSTLATLGKLDQDQRLSGLYVVGFEGLGVIAKDSFQSQVFDLVIDNQAVLENPSAKGTGNEVSMEQISLWAPEFIVFGEGSRMMADASEWDYLPAISAGQAYDVPSQPYNWLSAPPAVNQLLGLQWLARVAYPDLFDDDLEAVVTEYYQLFYGYELSGQECQELLGLS